jgi:hypothetical protein
MADRSDSERFDFAARTLRHKASAESHRLLAELTSDPTMKAVHLAAATIYENMAREIAKTAIRIAKMGSPSPIARTRAKISALPKSQPVADAPDRPAPDSQETNREP